MGNIVDGQYVAGVVHLSQQGLNAGAGFIRAIDYAKGELLVGPDVGGAPVARVRINDPKEEPMACAMPPRWVVLLLMTASARIPDNAAIVGTTGPDVYPARRAARQRCAVPAVEPPRPRPGSCAPLHCGPSRPSPPRHPMRHASRSGPRRCRWVTTSISQGWSPRTARAVPPLSTPHALQALAGIYTSPGANPAYVFTEEALVGTLGDPWPDIDQEETSRFRIVGFATDPSRRVDDVFAGQRWQRAPPDDAAAQTAGQIGRIRITLPAKANFLPVT